jgi:hypothetical protein
MIIEEFERFGWSVATVNLFKEFVSTDFRQEPDVLSYSELNVVAR